MIDEIIPKLPFNINDYLHVVLTEEQEEKVRKIQAEILAKDKDDEEEDDDEE